MQARSVGGFLIRPVSGTVRCCPEPGAAPAAVRHFLLNQILPRLLARARPLVLHASAVCLQGHAVLFAGGSGSGKSSLAASLVAHRGASLVSDDAVIVYPGTPCYAVGTYARSRLWSDARSGLGLAGGDDAETCERSKALLDPFGPGPAPGARLPLAAIFLIDTEPPRAEGIRLQPLVGAQAAMCLIERALALFDAARTTLDTQLQAVASIAESGLPILALSFPRRFDALDRVHDTLAEVLRGYSPAI